jgi:hypothetical protein
VKKIFVLFIFAVIISACDKSKSSSSDTSFRIKAGTLTKFVSPSSAGTNVNGTPYTYAIIYTGSINSTNYVGIAVTNDPESATYIKVYFEASSIPTGTGLTINNATINKSGAVTTGNTLTLDIALTSTSSNGTYTYNVYTITGNIDNSGASDTVIAVQTAGL